MEVKLHPTDENVLIVDGHSIRIGHFTGETIRDRLLIEAGRTPYDERPTQRWASRDAFGATIIPKDFPITKVPHQSPRLHSRVLTAADALRFLELTTKEGEPTDAP